jgi:hypothetical protein
VGLGSLLVVGRRDNAGEEFLRYRKSRGHKRHINVRKRGLNLSN